MWGPYAALQYRIMALQQAVWLSKPGKVHACQKPKHRARSPLGNLTGYFRLRITITIAAPPTPCRWRKRSASSAAGVSPQFVARCWPRCSAATSRSAPTRSSTGLRQGLRPAPITAYRALEFLRENGLVHRIESRQCLHRLRAQSRRRRARGVSDLRMLRRRRRGLVAGRRRHADIGGARRRVHAEIAGDRDQRNLHALRKRRTED